MTRLHHGKAHAYAPKPFQNHTFMAETYSADVRGAFVAKMNEYDPNGVFRAGRLLELLDIQDGRVKPEVLIDN